MWPLTGVVTVANPAALNYEVQPYNLFEITIKVQDADPVSPHRTDGFMRIETRVRVPCLHERMCRLHTSPPCVPRLQDVNEPPTLDAQVRSVKELTKAGAFVGVPIVATDVDGGVFGELTYELRAGCLVVRRSLTLTLTPFAALVQVLTVRLRQRAAQR